MKFLKLTDIDGMPILVNLDHIVLAVTVETATQLFLSGVDQLRSVGVRETPDEIARILGGVPSDSIIEM